MEEICIKVESFEDVRALSDLAATAPFPISVTDGQRTVDARSLMCIFSLNLEQPVRLTLRCDAGQADLFRQQVDRVLA